ncbi:T9SS type A sorting domain-containing protein [Dyadobacter subterraneus]|uniref:T9SS type A sorting domain-containing protein n=1 Tax=Dyadobacter subterraneus TaxID=2773304 RepID=A0ABR9WCD1_9BACT|nr:T9SS type A sorting domain-containing protein [Dyadobacter subterraneus]MBE9463053.1 T9SS type A sorting domain-containing protein [Dyadobacter subterraneus]
MSAFYRIVLLLCLCSSASYATHLLGGEIKAVNLTGQTYRISAQIYFDVTPQASGASAAQDAIMLCFGDGNTAQVKRTSFNVLTGDQSGVAVGTYEVTYTYPSAGIFQISTNIANRTSSLLNFANSEFSEMFLWTVIDTQVSNSTPVLPLPVFTAGSKQIFKIDLKSTVTDSDSTTAHLQRLSKTSPGTCGVRSLNESYIYPNDVNKKGTFYVDQTAKKLVWNAPELLGKYIYAVVIDEWRDGIKISETYREGLITVIDKPGQTVEIPPYVPVNDSGLVTSLPDSDNLAMVVDAYPVPTEDFLTVSVKSATATTLRIELINMNGQIVRQINTTESLTQWSQPLDLRQMAKGIYIIRVTDQLGKFVTRKVAR